MWYQGLPSLPECLGPSGTINIPEGLEMQLMKERQLMREPVCGISFIVMNTLSKRVDLFSVLHMMHEAGGWKSILMPVSGVRWIWADIGSQTIRAASLDLILAEGFLQVVIDVDTQPLIFLVPVHEYYDRVLFLWGYFFFFLNRVELLQLCEI